MDVAQFKRQAAEQAVILVESGMIVGLGHGSTAQYAVQGIARRLREGSLTDIVGIPCSREVEDLARQLEIPLSTLEVHPSIDLTIDGADEVTPALELIKGGGGALLREKIVAQVTHREIIIADGSKVSSLLGMRAPVPVEVLTFGWTTQVSFLRELGAVVEQRKTPDGSPLLTECGNYILDCRFGPLQKPAAIANLMDNRAGIVVHGLFLDLADEAFIAGEDGIRHWRKEQKDDEAEESPVRS